MKQFLNILKFEFSGYIKNKAFIGITLVIVLLVGIVLSYPRISEMIHNGSKDSAPKKKEVLLLNDMLPGDKERAFLLFTKGMPDKTIEQTDKNIDELKTLIENGEYSGAVVITAQDRYSYIVKNIGIQDTSKAVIDEIMKAKYRLDKMDEIGITQKEAQEILVPSITGDVIQMGKDQMKDFFYTYVLIFALYIAILLYGQFVAMSVASEKSSRAMELLITSAKPTNLMFGKVMGSGLSGLLQFVIIFGSAFIFFNINKSYWTGNEVIKSIFNMPLPILLYAVLFFILGYFIYSFLYGAIGSLVSKTEDVNSAVMPVTFLFIIAFFVVMFSMGSGNLDSTLIIVCSYIPFTAPMAMFARIAMGDVKNFEIIISVIILIASTFGTGYLAARIYKAGVLLYGKAPKLTDVFKIMKNAG